MVQSIQSREIYMYHLYAKSLHSPNRKIKISMMKQLNHMMMVDEVFSEFVDSSAHDINHCRFKKEDGQCGDIFIPKDYECLRGFVDVFESHCGKFTDYSRRFIKYLVRECEQPSMDKKVAFEKLT